MNVKKALSGGGPVFMPIPGGRRKFDRACGRPARWYRHVASSWAKHLYRTKSQIRLRTDYESSRDISARAVIKLRYYRGVHDLMYLTRFPRGQSDGQACIRVRQQGLWRGRARA